MPDLSQLDSAEKIAAAGEEIYRRLHQERLEAERPGQFVAVDVSTEEAYVAELSVDALQTARASAPTGVFHLIRIGSPTAFQKGYMSSHAEVHRRSV